MTYNVYWANSGFSYEDYLQERAVALEGTKPVVSAITAQTAQISGIMTQGFEQVEESLGRVNRSIEANTAVMRWGFSVVLSGISGLNDTLEELLEVAKTPAQTAAIEQYDLARDAYGRDLLPEALGFLDRAINGTDGVSAGNVIEWRFHFLKGLCYMGSFQCPSACEPAAAEASFLLAARYSRGVDDMNCTKALSNAGFAAYIQSCEEPKKIEDALGHAKKAVELDKEFPEAIYHYSKYLCAVGKLREGSELLARAIRLQGDYALAAVSDFDFSQHNSINSFMTKLHNQMLHSVIDIQRSYAKAFASVQTKGAIYKGWKDNFDTETPTLMYLSNYLRTIHKEEARQVALENMVTLTNLQSDLSYTIAPSDSTILSDLPHPLAGVPCTLIILAGRLDPKTTIVGPFVFTRRSANVTLTFHNNCHIDYNKDGRKQRWINSVKATDECYFNGKLYNLESANRDRAHKAKGDILATIRIDCYHSQTIHDDSILFEFRSNSKSWVPISAKEHVELKGDLGLWLWRQVKFWFSQGSSAKVKRTMFINEISDKAATVIGYVATAIVVIVILAGIFQF
jgi:tetratricopeptide (TPR) repeat protein